MLNEISKSLINTVTDILKENKIVDSQKNEEYGAGFEGTDGLLANYLDQTPHSKITHWPDTYKTFDDLRKEEDEDDPVFNTK